MTKYKSQVLHIIRIKYWKVGESGNLPFPIPVLWKIGILLHKQATYSDFIYIEFFLPLPPFPTVDFYPEISPLFMFHVWYKLQTHEERVPNYSLCIWRIVRRARPPRSYMILWGNDHTPPTGDQNCLEG